MEQYASNCIEITPCPLERCYSCGDGEREVGKYNASNSRKQNFDNEMEAFRRCRDDKNKLGRCGRGMNMQCTNATFETSIFIDLNLCKNFAKKNRRETCAPSRPS